MPATTPSPADVGYYIIVKDHNVLDKASMDE